MPTMAVAALGVVFGDIGTSPLYTLKTVLALTGGHPNPDTVLGVLSLVLWTLTLITTIKYVSVAMNVDNDGEGGILALMALLGVKRAHRPIIIATGLFGAALIYGDGAITPAISVLSALEGLEITAPGVEPYIVPSAVVILLVLFAAQSQGTARIGRAFGPVMLLWFLALAALGIKGIIQHPSVLAAIDPVHAIRYLFSGGAGAFLVLGGVFLCVTGAEALYADMGHFGARPIRFAWALVVFPALLLNYAGQAALVLEGAPTEDNIFYRLCPPDFLVPMVVLATIATIIASQSIITGAFSMTRQAIQLGWLPRMPIVQTSAEGYGQIYVGVVNWLLMAATIGLTILFGKSDNLAAAYGIAVSATMLMTSFLLFLAMREIWGWSMISAGAVALVFILVDAAFLAANMTKIAEGGYVPLAFAICIYFIMWVWHTGAADVGRRLHSAAMPVDAFVKDIETRHIARVPGSAVFLTRTTHGAPPVMIWHVRHNRALHEKLLVLTVRTLSVPWVRNTHHLAVEQLAPNFWRASADYGFMERPNIPALLKTALNHGCVLDLNDVTYYLGHETIIHREGRGARPLWLESMFAFMQRNSMHATEYFHLPSHSVVEIGRQIGI